MIYSFVGMNVKLGVLGTYPYSALFIFIGSVTLSIVIAILLKIKDML